MNPVRTLPARPIRPIRSGRPRLLTLFLPLLLLGLSSCDIVFPDQEVHLRLDRQADTLDILLIYKGLTVPGESEEQVDKGLVAMERLLRGDREFMIVEWPLYFEIEKWVAQSRELVQGDRQDASDAEERWMAATWLQIAPLISMQEHGLFQDDEGRLAGYQLLRIENFSQVVELLNVLASRAFLHSAEQAGWQPDDDWDPRTFELWLERARSGEPWFRMEKEGIVVDLPVTREWGRALRRGLALEIASKKNDDADEFADLLAEFAASVDRLEFLDDRCVFRVGATAPDRYRFELKNPEAVYREGLKNGLADRGLLPADGKSLKQVRALIDRSER